MSKEVWVRWKDSATGMVVTDTVRELKDGDEIKELRKAFVEQHEPDVLRAKVQVRETEDGEIINSSDVLTKYFVLPPDAGATKRPGRSEKTALFLTLPQTKKHHANNDLEEPPSKRLKSIGDEMVKLTYDASYQKCKELNDSLKFEAVKAITLPTWNRHLHLGSGNDAIFVDFLEREAHINLKNELMEQVTTNRRVVVTGMPGTGKSWFVDYFAWHCLSNGDAAILENDLADTEETVNFQIIVPGDNDSTVSSWCIPRSSEKWQAISAKVKTISEKMVNSGKRCWYLVDYRGVKTPILKNHMYLSTVNFASPSKKRWTNFFESDRDKGQEPIFMFSYFSGAEIRDYGKYYHWQNVLQKLNEEQIDGLMNLFGPSVRYCLTQFCKPSQGPVAPTKQISQVSTAEGELVETPPSRESNQGQMMEHAGQGATEYLKEVQPPGEADEETKMKKVAKELEAEWDETVSWSSRVMLENVVGKMPKTMQDSVRDAAMVIRGKILSAGAVGALEKIRSSPTESTNDDRISTRLLVWGKANDSYKMAYANYASPFICCLVMEEKSKDVLDFIARFFQNADSNVGTGSGWMYECFILKYWLPSLAKGQSFSLKVVGCQDDRQLVVPEGYRCEVFAELSKVDFCRNTMYLPSKRSLGAVDCFCLIQDTLWLFQITSALDHPTSEPELEKVLDLAGGKHGPAIKNKHLVFVVPAWRSKNYQTKAQIFVKSGRRISVGQVGKTNETLTFYNEIANEYGFQDVPDNKPGLRKVLKRKLAAKLREEPHNYQNSQLESWSVSRLYLYLNSSNENNDIVQFVWPVNKAQYDMFVKKSQ